jgi:hypothetical protein
MKSFKLIAPTFIAFLFTSLLYNNFSFFVLNIGATWLNIKSYQVIILGLLLSLVMVYIKSRHIIKLYKFLFLFLAVITLISTIDSISNLKNYSILCFLMMLLALNIYIDYIVLKLRIHN